MSFDVAMSNDRCSEGVRMKNQVAPSPSSALATAIPADGSPADRSEPIWNARKVALIMGANSAGSRERVMFRLAGRLIEEGASVDIVAAAPGAAWRREVAEGARLVDLAGPLIRPWPNLVRIMLSPPALARYLKRERPDLAMTLSIPTALAALTARRWAKTETNIVVRQSNVVHIGGSARYGAVDRRWRDPAIRKLYPDAAAIIAVSDGVADNLKHLPGIDPKRVHPVANGVLLGEIERLAGEPVSHPWFGDEKLRVPVVIAVGRLVPKKDYPTLLCAFKRVLAERDARLLVLGEGRERKRLQAMARDLEISDQVDFAGRVANPFAYLARASLYVLSSTYEGMPSALIEALACGCPAVSTDCPSGPSEILDHGRFGPLVSIGDVEGLANAMLEMLDDPPSRERLRTRAAQFGVARTVEGYLKVLAGVLPRHF